ncbi:MAG TPA: adenine phosphoribosyltransferase [Chloroflexota bacterium]|nr:adenine phosphoribosyltransferase [Chloroflexota bacterium]
MATDTIAEHLRSLIREVPGFPQEGILFYDITTVLKDPEAFRASVDLMARPFRDSNVEMVVAMESRGFIFGAPIAYLLGAGFAPIRKMGKLPAETVSREYTLEYATNTLEIHTDAIQPGQRVLLVDDLLATGGTVAASLDIVQELGGNPIGVAVLVELPELGGRARLAGYGVEVISFISYG